MKLRIRENSIRFRLTKSEVVRFGEKGSIENRTEFGNDQVFIYALKSSDSAQDLKASFENGRIEIAVPRSAAEKWVNSEEVGITGEDNSLKVIIEKDFACLTVREGEDESDNFPHPKTDQAC